MKPAELARWKTRLQDLRAEILREGDVEIEPVRSPTDIKADEDGAPLTEMSQVIASKRNRERAEVLGRVAKALERLGADPEAFGLCAECEEPIGKRLQVMPYVELCLQCQQERDGATKPGRRRHLTDFK